jgi:hypothetical protein
MFTVRFASSTKVSGQIAPHQFFFLIRGLCPTSSSGVIDLWRAHGFAVVQKQPFSAVVRKEPNW